jgi:hypothetical protein
VELDYLPYQQHFISLKSRARRHSQLATLHNGYARGLFCDRAEYFVFLVLVGLMAAMNGPGTGSQTSVIGFGRSGTEPYTNLDRVADAAVARVLEATQQVGPLATKDQELRDFAVGLRGYQVAEVLEPSATAGERAQFLEDKLGAVKTAEDGSALLLEGAALVYYMDMRANESGGRSGGGTASAVSGLLVARENVRLDVHYTASPVRHFTAAWPLADVVSGDTPRRNPYSAVNFGVEDSAPSRNERDNKNVDLRNPEGEPATIGAYLLAPQDVPSLGRSYVNMYLLAEGTRISTLVPRETSAALERLTTNFGFEPIEHKITNHTVRSLKALGEEPQELKFVRHAATGLVVGMGRTGTEMMLSFPEAAFPQVLTTHELARVLDLESPDRSKSRFDLNELSDYKPRWLSTYRVLEEENRYAGRDFHLSGLSPAQFDGAIKQILAAAPQVRESQLAEVAAQKEAEAAKVAAARLASEAKAAFERGLVDAETAVSQLAPLVGQDIGNLESLLKAAVAPIGATLDRLSYSKVVGMTSPVALDAATAALLDAGPAAYKAATAHLPATLQAQVEKNMSNTAGFSFLHPQSGLEISIAAMRLEGEKPRALWTISLERPDGKLTRIDQMNALMELPHQIRYFDGNAQFGTIEAVPARKLSLQFENPTDLVRYLANLRALPDELSLTA